MTPQEAAALIRRFIEAERAMRVRVFANKPHLRPQKLRECDVALEALDALLTTTQWQPVTRLEYQNPDTDPDCWQWVLYADGDAIGLVDAEDLDNYREIQLPPHLRLCRSAADATAEPVRPGLFDETQP